MPGDRFFIKPLEGRKFQNWYFASKFNFQNFRTDEYFEMQSERFEAREVHRSIKSAEQLLAKAASPRLREQLRQFFGRMDEVTFENNPSIRDLYGLFRLVDPDLALPFEPRPEHFREHSPIGGPRPPWRATFGGEGWEGAVDRELLLLQNEVKARLDEDAWIVLRARVASCGSVEEYREVLWEQAVKVGAVLPLSHSLVAPLDENALEARELPAVVTEPLPSEDEALALLRAESSSSTPLTSETEGSRSTEQLPSEDEPLALLRAESSSSSPLTSETEGSRSTEQLPSEGDAMSSLLREASGEGERTDPANTEGESAEAATTPAPRPRWPGSGLPGEWHVKVGTTPKKLVLRRDGAGLQATYYERVKKQVQGLMVPEAGGTEGAFAGELLSPGGEVFGLMQLRLTEGGTLAIKFRSGSQGDWMELSAVLVKHDESAEGDVEAAPSAETTSAAADAGSASGSPAAAAAPPSSAAPTTPKAADTTANMSEVMREILEATRGSSSVPSMRQAARKDLLSFPAEPSLGGSPGQRRQAIKQGAKDLHDLLGQTEEIEKALQELGQRLPAVEARERAARAYVARRLRFADPMYRRRRLKWLERQMADKNGPKEVEHNSYFAVHPDNAKEWPSNKGSVTVIWPSPYH